MRPIYTIHGPQADKMDSIKIEMQTLGAPVIRVVDCGDYYMALEGCHRIAAAYDIGIKPDLIVIGQDDEIDIRDFDWYDEANWSGTTYLAGEVAGELFSVQAEVYNF